MTLRTRALVGLRALTSLFFGASALYGILNFSPFAYQQFIRPKLLPWLVWSAASYGGLFIGVFSVTVLSLLDDVARPRTRRLSLAYIVVWGPAAIVLLFYPIVDRLGPNRGSLVFCTAALAPALWLAVIDHVACWRLVFAERDAAAEGSAFSTLFVAAAATSVYVWAVYTALALVRVRMSGQLHLLSMVGIEESLLLHVVVFTAICWVFVVAVALARAWERGPAVEYGLALAIFAIWIAGVLKILVLPAIAITGGVSWVVAVQMGFVMAAAWSGMALRLSAGRPWRQPAMAVFLRPLVPVRSGRALIVWLVVLPGAAYAAVGLSEQMDWAFLLQRGGVLAIWFLVWGAMITLAGGATRPSFGVAAGASVMILAGYGCVRFTQRHAPPPADFQRRETLDRYQAVDASFRTLDQALAERPSTPSAFYDLLQANTNVRPDVPIVPRPIRMASRITPVSARPHVFLLVFDSLRPDYLSSYNEAVTFTPSLDAFAADSLVFRRAFTRYGGTGLAVPSIWSGTMLPHRQYVLPFAPMNALLTLLEGESYRVMASLDSIMTQLMPLSPRMVELGADSRRSRDDGCSVLAEVGRLLDRPGTREPVFAYSLPQNTHISYVQGQPIAGEPVAGFYTPLVSRVRQIDGCFGAFIDGLKSRGIYDDSVVIVTSDHGDALGEGGRWGHGSAGFPEILRIPLIMHLPPRLAAVWSADVDAVSFSTDIVPTLYRLLGQQVELQGPMFGMPLVYSSGMMPPRERRRGAFLLAGSYDPVYALLQRNGELMYVVDAMNARDYAFDLAGGAPHARPVPVTGAERTAYQRLIAEQIDQIAAFFGFDALASR